MTIWTILTASAAMALTPLAAIAATPRNALLTPSTLPMEAPPFDRIADADYQPALDAGMAEHLAEIGRIANDPAPPSFANTIVAMERSGRTLTRASLAFAAVNQANTNKTLQAVQTAEAPRLAQHRDAVYLDPRLFARVDTLWQMRASLALDREAAMLLDVVHQDFIHAGAKLSDPDKARLRTINTRLSTLETAFQQTLLAATKAGALVVDDQAKLAGLTDAEITAAAIAATERGMPGKWLIPLQNTTQQPALQPLTDRATRRQLFEHSWLRAERPGATDTRPIIVELAQLRAQKAQLLGYPSFAAYALSDQMAKTPAAAQTFMARLAPPTAAEQRREAAEIQRVIDAEAKASGTAGFAVAPWDWAHYAERVRKARYDLDENEIRPYFELDRVLRDGVFYAANQLYGISFHERKDLPVYHPDVRTFDVVDQDGKPLGLMYFDYFKRDNKNGGAWMSNFVDQSKLLGTHPVIYNVANLPKPAPGHPALISYDDVVTMFHEFGHALHGLFADQTYPTLSGTSVARDFVEFPSQFNEHWALDPKVFAHYAVHYQTGGAMPQTLVDKIRRAAKFDQGYALGELVAAAELDLAWHSLPAGAPQDVDGFEAAALAKTGLDTKDVPPRYRSSYFQHIWSNGYAAGYYAYLWTQMLDNDAFAWFTAHGGLTRANGQRFRDLILSRGHTLDYGPMFRAFYGKDPDIGPMLQNRGLQAE